MPGDQGWGRGGGSSRAGPSRAWECGSRPVPTRGLGENDECPGLLARRQGLGLIVDCTGPPRGVGGCVQWGEGGARPPLTPTYKSRSILTTYTKNDEESRTKGLPGPYSLNQAKASAPSTQAGPQKKSVLEGARPDPRNQ